MRRRDFVAGLAGAAFARSAIAQANERKRVGVLMSTTETDPREHAAVAAFIGALAEFGWVEGRTVDFLYRWGAGDSQRMEKNARAMVALKPDVILVKGAAMPATRQATSTIPLVFVVVGDAGAQQFVPNFARPGGNITGFTSNELTMAGKRLQLLREMSPEIVRVLYVTNVLLGAGTDEIVERIKRDAASVGVSLVDRSVRSSEEIKAVIEAFAGESRGGIVVAFNAFTTVHRTQIVALAARHRLPAIYPLRVFTDEGGLFSYGFNQDDQFRRSASYIDRILKGEKPGDLPVQEPTTFELVINLKTASALGLNIPPTLLARADEVVE
jgi:ABC-type uncharacterized transport system substrate-binding protein